MVRRAQVDGMRRIWRMVYDAHRGQVDGTPRATAKKWMADDALHRRKPSNVDGTRRGWPIEWMVQDAHVDGWGRAKRQSGW